MRHEIETDSIRPANFYVDIELEGGLVDEGEPAQLEGVPGTRSRV